DIVLLHVGNESLDVVAHKVKLMNVVFVGWMHRDLSGRQSKDQPPASNVDVRKSQHFTQKSALRFSIRAVDDRMCANDHKISTAWAGPRPLPKIPRITSGHR